jgi:hypothetical protein
MIKPDWRIVKVDWTSYCDEEWRRENKIDRCGVYYLVDANLHVHICSFTPNLEAWAMVPWWTTDAAEIEDDTASEIDQALMQDENVSYFGTELLAQSAHQPAPNVPEQEEGESYQDYRHRVAEEVREYLQGNPPWF